MNNQQVRIFVSSPGDVKEERDIARIVIASLAKRYRGVELQAVFWEDLALPSTASFQETVDLLLGSNPIDISVFILWARLGSPLESKIVKTDGSRYRSGTEREFDLMLEAYQRSDCKRPVILTYTRNDDQGFVDRLRNEPANSFQELVSQRDLAKSFIEQNFQDADGQNIRAFHSYSEPKSFAQLLLTHLKSALNDIVKTENLPTWNSSPYRCLEAFELEHAEIFCGRDNEIHQVVSLLREQERLGRAFVVIVGASGAGKSSLAMAGVASALKQSTAFDVVDEWRVIKLTPGIRKGNLASFLFGLIVNEFPSILDSQQSIAELSNDFVQNPDHIVKYLVSREIERTCRHGKGSVRLLIVVDQLEELWTDSGITDEHRSSFFSAIESLAASEVISIIATLRSDFYSQAQEIPEFLRLKSGSGQFDLVSPDPGSIERMITEPASLAGIRFEQDESTGQYLYEAIARDATNDHSVLPLLEYTLSALFDRRDKRRNQIDFATYKRIGGIEGAIGTLAAEIFSNLSDDARASLPEILPLLVSLDLESDQPVVRRRANLSELNSTPARKELVERLVQARFISTDEFENISFGCFSHEALLRHWEQVAKWIAVNQDNLRVRSRIELSQVQWQEASKDNSFLLRKGLSLEEARVLLNEARHLLSADTVAYIEHSISLANEELRRRKRRNRIVVTSLVALSILSIASAIVAFIQRDTAIQAASSANKATQAARLAEGKADISAREAKTAESYAASQFRAANLALVTTQHREAELQINAGRLPEALEVALESLDRSEGDPESELLSSAMLLRTLDRFCLDRYVNDARFESVSNNLTTIVTITTGEQHYLVSGSLSGQIEVWDSDSQTKLGSVKHRAAVTEIVASTDSTKCFSSSLDGDVLLIDCQRGIVEQTFHHPRAVRKISASPNNKFILTLCDDEMLRVWDIDSGEISLKSECLGLVKGVTYQQAPLRALVRTKTMLLEVSLDDMKIVSSHKAKVIEASIKGDRFLLSDHAKEESKMLDFSGPSSFSRTAPTFAGAKKNTLLHAYFVPGSSKILELYDAIPTLRIWDAANVDSQKSFTVEQLVSSNGTKQGAYMVPFLSVAATGQFVMWDRVGNCSLWSATEERKIADLKHNSTVVGVSWSSANTLVTFTESGSLYHWNVVSGKLKFKHLTNDRITGVRRSDSGRTVWFSTESGKLTVLNASDLSEFANLPHHAQLEGWVFHENDVFSWCQDGTIYRWSANPNVVVTDYAEQSGHGLSVSGDGELVLIKGKKVGVGLVDRSDGKTWASLKLPKVEKVWKSGIGTLILFKSGANIYAVDSKNRNAPFIKLPMGEVEVISKTEVAVVRGEANTAVVWRSKDGFLNHKIIDITTKSFCFDRDLQAVFALDEENIVSLLSLDTGTVTNDFASSVAIDHLVVANGGRIVALSEGLRSTLWQIENGLEPVELYSGNSDQISTSFSKTKNDTAVAIASRTGTLTTFWLADPKQFTTRTFSGRVWFPKVFNNGDYVSVFIDLANSDQQLLFEMDEFYSAPVVIGEDSSFGFDNGWSYSDDMRFVLTWRKHGRLEVIDLKPNTKVLNYQHSAPVEGAFFSFENQLIVFWDDRGVIHRLSLISGDLLSDIKFPHAVLSVRAVPSQDYLVVELGNGTSRFLADAKNNNELRQLAGQKILDRSRNRKSATQTPATASVDKTGSTMNQWGDKSKLSLKRKMPNSEIATMWDGGVLLTFDGPLPELVQFCEYNSRDRFLTLVFTDGRIKTMDNRIGGSMQKALTASEDIILYMLFANDKPLGYKVPIIKF